MTLADAGERPAQLLGQARSSLRRRGDGEQVERAVGAGDGEMPVGEIDVGFGCLEPMRRDAPALLDDFARGACAVMMLARRSERPECEPAPIATRSVSPVTSRTLRAARRAIRRAAAQSSSRGPGRSTTCRSTISTMPSGQHRDLGAFLRRAARATRHSRRARCRAAGRAPRPRRGAAANPSQSASANARSSTAWYSPLS